MTDGFDYDDIRGSVEKHIGKDNVGWVQILSDCFEEIKAHCDNEKRTYPPVGQIKQKYGTLRIYLDGVAKDPLIQSILRENIQRADKCCERCGNTSTPQCIGFWYANLCCWHAHKVAAERMTGFPKARLNMRQSKEPLQCRSCGYIGQIAWGASGHRCPACVAWGW